MKMERIRRRRLRFILVWFSPHLEKALTVPLIQYCTEKSSENWVRSHGLIGLKFRAETSVQSESFSVGILFSCPLLFFFLREQGDLNLPGMVSIRMEALWQVCRDRSSPCPWYSDLSAGKAALMKAGSCAWSWRWGRRVGSTKWFLQFAPACPLDMVVLWHRPCCTCGSSWSILLLCSLCWS